MLVPQKNIPLPKSLKGSTRRRRYPFDTMAVGDMFFVPDKSRNTMSTHVSLAGQKLGRRFATRMLYMVETEEGWALAESSAPGAVLGVGVWRLS